MTNLASLPEGEESHPKDKELPAGEPKPVTVGLSFSGAPEVTSGTWVDTIAPGETLLYRVKVEDGQTARFTANGPTGGFRFPSDSSFLDELYVDGIAYSPDREPVGTGYRVGGSFSTKQSSPESASTATVRYRNRFVDDFPSRGVSASNMSGWYYYAVSIRDYDVGEDLAGQPIKIAFTVDVEGKPSKAVKYDEPVDDGQDEKKDSTTDEAASTSTDDEGSALPWAWVGGGAVVALLLGAGTWVAVRRLRTGRTG